MIRRCRFWACFDPGPGADPVNQTTARTNSQNKQPEQLSRLHFSQIERITSPQSQISLSLIQIHRSVITLTPDVLLRLEAFVSPDAPHTPLTPRSIQYTKNDMNTPVFKLLLKSLEYYCRSGFCRRMILFVSYTLQNSFLVAYGGLAKVIISCISSFLFLFALLNSATAQSIDSRVEGLPTAEFHFARLVYKNAINSRRAMRGGSAWSTDYADAEHHLMQGINRLTRVDGQPVDYNGQGGRLITLQDDRIFDYPWLYAVEVGQWYLNDQEAALLREYLDRGGFLLVDDFWGEEEWSVFVDSMHRVFPDRPIQKLPEQHEILHIHFDLDQRTQIPGRNGQRPGTRPHWRAIFDDQDRVVVAINFNMDMGDAWEHADDPWYPLPMTALAYRFAMNYVIYSMTH